MKTNMSQKVFVDFRSENKPFIHPDKIVFGVLDNYKYSAKHMISDYFQVQNATQIVFILPREMEERKKEKILECLQKENKECFSLKTYSFYDEENIFKIFPELIMQKEENINFLTCKSKTPFSIILPNLYISDMHFAQNKEIISALSISAVINLAPDVAKNAFELEPNFAYLTLYIQDNSTTDIAKYFAVTRNFIDKYINSRGVLVHCAAGISRSATIIIAYVMKTLHLSFQSAFSFVQDRHPIADPNLNFLLQLMQYDEK